MASYVTMHLHNAVPGKEKALADWFSGPHAKVLPLLRGFLKADRLEVTERQTPVSPVQPWKYMSVYDFELDHPEIHIPALGMFLADARDQGLIAQDGSECIWSYAMYDHSKFAKNYVSAGYNPKEELSHILMLPANFLPGMEEVYHKWYDEVHSREITEMPGFVGMRRGRLLPEDLQIEPRQFCAGSQIIFNSMQTKNLDDTIEEFIARAYGKSKTPEMNHGPRHHSASVGRTVHIFKRLATNRP
jgi:hypothetical protein